MTLVNKNTTQMWEKTVDDKYSDDYWDDEVMKYIMVTSWTPSAAVASDHHNQYLTEIPAPAMCSFYPPLLTPGPDVTRVKNNLPTI